MSVFTVNKNDEGDDSMSTSPIESNRNIVRSKIDSTAAACGRAPSSVRLVAVSKTKPSSDIEALYNSGHRHFGENYFQELLDKAATLPKDISWHFIGHLQSAKASKLVREVGNLAVVETVDTEKLAKKLNSACESADRACLDIFIQVDTSNEDTKSGVPASEAASLAKAISESCPRLRVTGLMTIGAPGDMACFDRLVECRVEVAATLGMDVDSLELSMGMSGDFEEAIHRGSTNVRVGSTIFGPRIYN